LDYLHTRSPVVVHRDLKLANVMLDEHWVRPGGRGPPPAVSPLGAAKAAERFELSAGFGIELNRFDKLIYNVPFLATT